MKIEGTGNINVATQVYVPDISTDTPDIQTEHETAEVRTQKNVPSENTVKQAVSDINKKINANTIAKYGYHEETNRVTIKLIDKNSDEVIKEFPAEETLDMIAKVWELAGVFLDERG